jgi:hypothetical protein
MNAKYKRNQEITELSKWSLPPITPDQIKWGYEHCLDKYAHRSRGKLYCLECGHSWKPDNNRKIQVCPSCASRLKMIKHYRFRGREAEYMAVVTVCGGYQVVRMVMVSKRLAMNWPAEYHAAEVMQHWIDENANHTTMTISVNGISAACDVWKFNSEMKVKETRGGYKAEFRHNLAPYRTYPKVQLLPIFRRNGFKGKFHYISPRTFFDELLRGSHFETLLKSKQYSMLRYSISRSIHYALWPSVKICIRNKYIIKDASMWADYIELLKYFRKDVHNAAYVCPADLTAEHDRLVLKKRRKQALEKIEHQRKRIDEANAQYLQEKQKFFGLKFSEGELSIAVLPTVADFLEEGKELHHCVFENEYYAKGNSLILSARKGEKRLETIEIALSTMSIVQSRGLHNQSTEYHDQIINLVQNNLEAIQQVAV